MSARCDNLASVLTLVMEETIEYHDGVKFGCHNYDYHRSKGAVRPRYELEDIREAIMYAPNVPIGWGREQREHFCQGYLDGYNMRREGVTAIVKRTET